jgi:hypothetical protein
MKYYLLSPDKKFMILTNLNFSIIGILRLLKVIDLNNEVETA